MKGEYFTGAGLRVLETGKSGYCPCTLKNEPQRFILEVFQLACGVIAGLYLNGVR